MSKKFLVASLLICAAFVFFFFFSVRADFLKNHIRKNAEKSGFKVSIEAAYWRLPFKIHLKKVSLESEEFTFSSDDTTLSISPLKYLLKKPFLGVFLKFPSIMIKNIPEVAPGRAAVLPISGVSVEGGTISHGAVFFENINGNVGFDNDRVNGFVKATVKKSKIFLRARTVDKDILVDTIIDNVDLSDYTGLNLPYVGKIIVKNRISKGVLSAKIKGNISDFVFTGEGSYEKKKDYSLKIDWKKQSGGSFSEGSFDLSGQNGGFDFDATSGESYLSGSGEVIGGEIRLSVSTSTIKIPEIKSSFYLRLNAAFGTDKKRLSADITSETDYDKKYRATSNILLADGTLFFSGKIAPKDTTFDIRIKNFREISGEISGSKKSRITLMGNLSPVRIFVKASGWEISETPFFASPSMGKIFSDGEFSMSAGEWLFKSQTSLKNIRWDGRKFDDVSARLLVSRTLISVSDIDYSYGKITGSYKNVYGARKEISFRASGAPIEPLSLFIGRPISGTLKGEFALTSENGVSAGKMDIDAKKITVKNADIGDIKAFVKFEGNTASFERILIKNDFGRIAGGVASIDKRVGGMLNFVSYSFDGKTPLSGRLHLSGEFGNFNDFSIKLNSENFTFGKLFRNVPLSFAFKSEKESVKISGFRFGEVRDAHLRVEKTPSRRISGAINVDNFDLGRISTDLSGSLNSDINLYGDMENPMISALYEVKNLCWRKSSSGSLKGKARIEKGVVRIYETSGDFEGTNVKVSGTVSDKIDIRAEVLSVDVSKIILSRAIKSGSLKSEISLTGKVSSPYLIAKGELGGLDISGMRFEKVVFEGAYSDGAAELKKASVIFNGNELAIEEKSRIDFVKRIFDINFLSRNFKVGFLSVLGRAKIKGSYRLAPAGFEGRIELSDFWIGEKKFAREVLYFSADDKNLTMDIAENKEKFVFSVDYSTAEKVFKLDYSQRDGGTLSASGSYRAPEIRLDIKAVSLKTGALSSMLDMPFELNGLGDIKGSLTGVLSNPYGDLSLTIKNGSLGGVAYDEISCDISLRESIVTVERFSISKAGKYRVYANGYVPVLLDPGTAPKIAALPNNLTATLEGGELGFLAGISVFKNAEGPVAGKLELKGTHSSPKLAGFLRIENANFGLTTYLAKVENFNLSARLKDNVLTLENFSGRSGAGRFMLKGRALMENFLPAAMDFSFESTTASGVDIFVPELPMPVPFSRETGVKFATSASYGKPRFKLSFLGDARKKLLLAGWIELDNTYFSYPPPHMTAVEDPLREFLKNVELDLMLKTGENTWYENELASVNIDGSLNVKGNWYAPSVSGAVETKRGYISYIGTEFKVKMARLEVVGDEPHLEGLAEKNIPSEKGYDTIQLIIDKSPVGKIQPRFVSADNPTLSSEKVLARVIGIDLERTSPVERELMLRQGLIRLIDSSLATPLARNLLRKSGIVDLMKVSYEPPPISESPRAEHPATIPELLKGTKYSFEKYVTDTMLLGYSVTLDEYLSKLDLKHELEIAYRLRGSVFVRGLYEIDTQSLIRPPERRITVEKHWRFGWPKK